MEARDKGNAFRGIAHQIVDNPWADGDTTINVVSFEVDEHHRVVVQCEAWRGGSQLALDLPFIYVNPPLIHNGVHSPIEAARRMIADTVRLF